MAAAPSSTAPPQATSELLDHLAWLDSRIGVASNTEPEIEHSFKLLPDPKLAGQASKTTNLAYLPVVKSTASRYRYLRQGLDPSSPCSFKVILTY